MQNLSPNTTTEHAEPIRFSTAYSRLLANELNLAEEDWRLLLEGTSQTVESLNCNHTFISHQEQKAIIRNALSLTQQPGLGLRLGSKLHLIAHGPVGVAAFSAPNVAEGFNVMLRYQSIRAQFVTLALFHHDEHLVVRLTPNVELDAVGQFLMEAMAASFRCSLEFLLGQPAPIERFNFQYTEPSHAELYQQHLQKECHFDQAQSYIILSKEILKQRSLYSDPNLYERSLQQCQQIEQQLKSQQTLAEQIRQHLRKGNYNDSLEIIASHFNACPRTLIRKLQTEDTCFREIKEQELQSAALERLAQPSHTIESIAKELGYQNSSSFRRAFQRWFNQAPSEYRTHSFDLNHR